ncbi:hypothetical protein [Roseateles chitosanitabidus]|uniref:hypothetical protein n=1 Tax=Roseateles chitosanitabidus TaxID=65048 RepID=UPI00082FA3EF|nr:hypothetical protein [Roseateles chitosanitabidus]MBO9686127.1 hypothetical protein [Roseateles chitosanitabidus]
MLNFFFTVVRLAVASALLHGTACIAQAVQLPRTEVSGKLVRDPTWMPYRDARRAIDTFERYTKPKDLVRLTYLLSPKWPQNFSFEGLTFAIEDDETLVPLPHQLGLADVPLRPPVNERTAHFVANRPKGTLKLSYHVSLALRADQRYEQPYLREGCAQTLDVYRTQTALTQLQTAGKQCVGVEIHLLTADSTVIQRDTSGEEHELPSVKGHLGRQVKVRWTDQLQAIEVRPPDRAHLVSILLE